MADEDRSVSVPLLTEDSHYTHLPRYDQLLVSSIRTTVADLHFPRITFPTKQLLITTMRSTRFRNILLV
jgi:hypothetical protein